MYLEYSLTLEMFGREKKTEEGMDRHSGRSDVLKPLTSEEELLESHHIEEPLEKTSWFGMLCFLPQPLPSVSVRLLLA